MIKHVSVEDLRVEPIHGKGKVAQGRQVRRIGHGRLRGRIHFGQRHICAGRGLCGAFHQGSVGHTDGGESVQVTAGFQQTGAAKGVVELEPCANRGLESEGHDILLIGRQGCEQLLAFPNLLVHEQFGQLAQQLVAHIKIRGQGTDILGIHHRRLDSAIVPLQTLHELRGNHTDQRIRHMLAILGPHLVHIQFLPRLGQDRTKLDWAVHRGFHQQSADVGDLQCFRFYFCAVGILVKALALGSGAAHVEIDRTVLVVKGQGCVAAGAQTAPNHLLDTAHVPPGVADMHLTNKPEIHTLRDLGRCDDHTDQTAIHVLRIPGQ